MVMELGGNRLTQVHLEKWPLKWSVCVITELAVYLVLLVVVVAVLRTKYRWIRWWNQLQQPRTTHRHRQDLMHILLSKYNHSLTSLYRCNPSSLVCSLVVSDCFRATAYHRSGFFCSDCDSLHSCMCFCVSSYGTEMNWLNSSNDLCCIHNIAVSELYH